MSPHLDTLFWFRVNQSLFFLLNKEATNTNFIVFGLTRSVLEPTIYRTWGEHANQYTTDAILHQLRFITESWMWICSKKF